MKSILKRQAIANTSVTDETLPAEMRGAWLLNSCVNGDACRIQAPARAARLLAVRLASVVFQTIFESESSN